MESPVFLVTHAGRLVFRLKPEAGTLESMKKQEKTQPCAFASGVSLDPGHEETVFLVAAKAKNWDNFLFKLKLEGFEVRAGDRLRLPFGKL